MIIISGHGTLHQMYTRIRLIGQNWYTHNPKDCTIGKSCDMLLCEQSEGWKKLFYNKISNLFDHQGKSKNHVVSTKFKYLLCPIQEKGQRIPFHIQDKVHAELNKLLSEGHIEKLDKRTSDCFIAPIVITVKKKRFDQASSRRQTDKQTIIQKQILNAKR